MDGMGNIVNKLKVGAGDFSSSFETLKLFRTVFSCLVDAFITSLDVKNAVFGIFFQLLIYRSCASDFVKDQNRQFSLRLIHFLWFSLW